MRKLATIRRIDEVLPIEGADAIVIVKIDGWQCVALKEEFEPGDLCVYFEIDSFIPIMPQVEHLRARAFKRMGDKEGIRIKTIKLRGQLSQGLALPATKFVDMFIDSDEDEGQELCEFFFVGHDVSEWLGVEKFESPIPTQLSGQVKGNFPNFIPKTEQERCQNIVRSIFEENKDTAYEVTMKLDGTSFTAYRNNDSAGVCGRNWDLDLEDWNAGNSLVRMYIDSGLQSALHDFGRNIALQGELMGPGIQKNREGLASNELFVFDIYDIDAAQYVPAMERYEIMQELYARGLNRVMVGQVPVLAKKYSTLAELGITNISELLAYADGKSIAHSIREGVVFKSFDGKFSFKVISNKFLLKEED